MDEDQRLVAPDGQSVRRLRHERAYSPRALVYAIAEASERATGLRRTITPHLLAGVEERNERIPWATVRLIADGLACDPSELLPHRREG